MNDAKNEAACGASSSDAVLDADAWRDEWDGCTHIGPRNPPPTKVQIAARLRKLADEMDDISVDMDYYGGLAEWAQHGREIAGAGKIAREWADEIEAANVFELSDTPKGRKPGAKRAVFALTRR